MYNFIPKDFDPPEKIRLQQFLLRTLKHEDAEEDYKAVMSSIDLIKRIRGGSWPTEDLTLEENKIDLAWHQREFEYKTSFAYSVWDEKEKEYLGCFYIYPPDKPWVKAPNESDAVINLWVTQKAYNAGFYPKLFKTLKDWVKAEWPFKNPYYSNKEIPV